MPIKRFNRINLPKNLRQPSTATPVLSCQHSGFATASFACSLASFSARRASRRRPLSCATWSRTPPPTTRRCREWPSPPSCLDFRRSRTRRSRRARSTNRWSFGCVAASPSSRSTATWASGIRRPSKQFGTRAQRWTWSTCESAACRRVCRMNNWAKNQLFFIKSSVF